ncbi:MAG: phosphatidate cytidylyltransferase [Acidobacteriota bacterium]|nr:phosphatidate cytidylyltransferase [Acidobacteriota bacterium]
MSETRLEGTSTMLTRVGVGAAYFLAVVGCLYAGVMETAAVVALMGCLCAWELLRLLRASGRQPNDVIALAATLLFAIAPLAPPAESVTVVAVLLLMACAIWYVGVPRVTVTDVGMTLFVPIYCGFAFSTVTMIRLSDPGMPGFLLAFGVMGSIWLNDAMAYFVGSRLGRHKLAPRISPNKSVEGFWGGLAGCMLIWVLLVVLKVQGMHLLFAIPCGLCVGLASVMGDLFESRMKRGFGVKDSGTLLPGHGGMLDRSDALLFGCMTAFLLLHLGGIL